MCRWKTTKSRGAWGGNAHAQMHFLAWFQPGTSFEQVSLHVRTTERRWKKAQTCTWVERWNKARTWALVQRLRADMQLGPPWIDSCKWKKVQWSPPLQQKVTRVRGKRSGENAHMTGVMPGLSALSMKIRLVQYLLSTPWRLDCSMPCILFILMGKVSKNVTCHTSH